MVKGILILLIAAALALFAVQNAATVIPLVVLGQPWVSLPLSVWLLGAIAAGAITTLLFSALLQVGNPRPKRSTYYASQTYAPKDAAPRTYHPSPKPAPNSTGSPAGDRPRAEGSDSRAVMGEDEDWGLNEEGDRPSGFRAVPWWNRKDAEPVAESSTVPERSAAARSQPLSNPAEPEDWNHRRTWDRERWESWGASSSSSGSGRSPQDEPSFQRSEAEAFPGTTSYAPPIVDADVISSRADGDWPSGGDRDRVQREQRRDIDPHPAAADYDESGYDESGYDEPDYDEPGYDELSSDEPEKAATSYDTAFQAQSSYHAAPAPDYESDYEPDYGEPDYDEPDYGAARYADVDSGPEVDGETEDAHSPYTQSRYFDPDLSDSDDASDYSEFYVEPDPPPSGIPYREPGTIFEWPVDADAEEPDAVSTPGSDAADDWDNWTEPTSDPFPSPPRTETEEDIWDDWDEPEPAPPESTPTPTKITEVQRPPVSQRQTGTVYSYTYRRPQEPETPEQEES
jgi:uncharacterized integral membrane protein